jgi:hypothetical protein
MLHQNVKAQGFRVLSECEIGAVCGGMDEFQERDIEVNGWGSDRGFGGGGGSGWMFDGGGTTQFGSGFGTARYNWAFMSALDDVTTPDANATPAPPPQQPPGAPKTSELCQAAAGGKAIGEVVMTASGVVLAYGALTGPLAPATETAASLSFLAGGAIWGMGSLMQMGAWAGGNPCP